MNKPEWIAAIDAAIEKYQSKMARETGVPDDGTVVPVDVAVWKERALKAESDLIKAGIKLDRAKRDAFTMAAGQCCVKNGGLTDDDHGNQFCAMQRQRDELRGRLRVMADIMGGALNVMKTIDDGCDPDNESALDNLRSKMAGAIDSVLVMDRPQPSPEVASDVA